MRRSARDMWIAALTVQTEFQGKIANDPGAPLLYDGVFSPLGILCETHRRCILGHEWSGYPYLPQVYASSISSLPAVVMEWAGISVEDAKWLQGRSKTSILRWLQGIRNQEALRNRKMFQLDLLPMLNAFSC